MTPLTIISFAERPLWSSVGECDEKSIWVQFAGTQNGTFIRYWDLLPRDQFDMTRPTDPPSFFEAETPAPSNFLHHVQETWRSFVYWFYDICHM